MREEKAADRALDKELDMLKRQLREAKAENETLDRELMEQERSVSSPSPLGLSASSPRLHHPVSSP